MAESNIPKPPVPDFEWVLKNGVWHLSDCPVATDPDYADDDCDCQEVNS